MSKKKRKRMTSRKREFLERAGYTNLHHIRARSKGGKATPRNLFRWDERRHAAYHLIFGTLTFLQAAELLMRADQMKRRQQCLPLS